MNSKIWKAFQKMMYNKPSKDKWNKRNEENRLNHTSFPSSNQYELSSRVLHSVCIINIDRSPPARTIFRVIRSERSNLHVVSSSNHPNEPRLINSSVSKFSRITLVIIVTERNSVITKTKTKQTSESLQLHTIRHLSEFVASELFSKTDYGRWQHCNFLVETNK